MKVNNFQNKIPYTSTLIHIYQFNTDEQYLEKKIWDVDKKLPGLSGLVTTTFLNTRFGEVT